MSCEKCKLHGKLSLLGLGTALKILLVPRDMLTLSREEVVALINTLEKFSRAIQYGSQLREMYEEANSGDGEGTAKGVPSTPPSASQSQPPQHKVVTPQPPQRQQQQQQQQQQDPQPSAAQPPSQPLQQQQTVQIGAHPSVVPPLSSSSAAVDGTAATVEIVASDVPVLPVWAANVVDDAVGLIDQLAVAGQLTSDEEDGLIDGVVYGSPALLALVKHYGNRPDRFAYHAKRTLSTLRRPPVVLSSGREYVSLQQQKQQQQQQQQQQQGRAVSAPGAVTLQSPGSDDVVDAVIIGSGVAGLTAAVSLFDRGATVVILEKEAFLGGNSVKVWCKQRWVVAARVSGDPSHGVVCVLHSCARCLVTRAEG